MTLNNLFTIDTTAPSDQIEQLKRIADALEDIAGHIGGLNIYVQSGYLSPIVNLECNHKCTAPKKSSAKKR